MNEIKRFLFDEEKDGINHLDHRRLFAVRSPLVTKRVQCDAF